MQPDLVDIAIASINMQELYRRRMVRGRDLNEWFDDLEAWIAAGEYEEALTFLGEAIGTVETLEQFDNREPQPYWFQKAADLYEDSGEPEAAAKVLRRWLESWPPRRERRDGMREVVCTRIAQLSRVAS